MPVRSALIAAAAGAVLVGVAMAERHHYGANQHAAGYAQAQSDYMVAVAHAEGRTRQVEHEMAEKLEIMDHEARETLAQAVAAERRAADERVRSAAEQYAARYRQSAARAAATAEREAANSAIGMFAELLGGLDGLAEVYAAEADRRRIAGLTCERAYDQVRDAVPR